MYTMYTRYELYMILHFFLMHRFFESIEALKLASNARCFANRAVASLYLGNFEQCLEAVATVATWQSFFRRLECVFPIWITFFGSKLLLWLRMIHSEAFACIYQAQCYLWSTRHCWMPESYTHPSDFTQYQIIANQVPPHISWWMGCFLPGSRTVRDPFRFWISGAWHSPMGRFSMILFRKGRDVGWDLVIPYQRRRVS